MNIQFGFVSTYPPTYCGIATFTASLMNAIKDSETSSAVVVRLMDNQESEADYPDSPEIMAHMVAGDEDSISESARLLNQLDVAVIQHEFGIYGGEDGQEVLDLVEQLVVPIIVVLHTVTSAPSPNQKRVLESLCSIAMRIIVMSIAAKDRLNNTYEVDQSKITIVPHGARALPVVEKVSEDTKTAKPTRILTWGLLGPGKGIEWAVEAMGLLKDISPTPEYIVAGRTHPNVLKREGEAYRDGLQERIEKLELSRSVHFQGGYLSSPDLASLVSSCDIVLLPYDSTDQVTSGVLIEAVTARKPVVATAFPHAVELLASGAGIVVEHRSPQKLAGALRKIIENPSLAKEMSEQSSSIANDLLWSTVANKYIELAEELLRIPISAVPS